jgi:hypothetical protein
VNYVDGGPAIGWYLGGFVMPLQKLEERARCGTIVRLDEGPMKDLTRIMIGRVIGLLKEEHLR